MFRKMTLAVAAGAGYVLGAKAGKERYEQIESKFRELAGMPAVQNATQSVKETAASVKDSAAEAADSAKSTVNDKVESAAGKGEQAADKAKGKPATKSTPPPVNIGASTSSSPAAGAAPSGTAPDVV